MKKVFSLQQLICMAILALASVGCSNGEKMTLRTAKVADGDIFETVTATGTLESVSQVDVGTQITGIVSKLFADYNSIVKAGELIAEIDKTTLESDMKSASSAVQSAKSTYEYTLKNYNRDRELHDKQLISDYEYDTSKRDFLMAKATYERSKADLIKANRNLSYAEIYSPINGIVVARDVEVGQTVVSNMSVANLFTIADLDNMQVVANVDEADIGLVKVGQNATFTVDAYPNDVFKGKVTQVRINPTTASNVVTYQVLINTDNPEHKLIPGLTANITINVKEATNVITIPIKALKFYPQDFGNNKDMPTVEGKMPEAPSKGEKNSTSTSEDMHKVVYVVRKNKLIPTEIEIGADNGVNVEVTSGLKVGEKIALEYSTDGDEASDEKNGSNSPFMPKFSGGKKKNGANK